jgi:hypothetical protein
MTTVFIVCATLGGTVMVLQFLLALLGLGGHIFHADFTGDVGHDFSGGFHGDMGGDLHGDLSGGVHGEAGGGLHGEAHSADHADQSAEQHGVTMLFRILTFRTVTAALAFFGLSGLAAESAGISTPGVIAIAIASGAAALAAVYWTMRFLQELWADGTVHIQRALGQHGNAYLHIPGNHAGSGKIQFNLQNRTMEYLAVTSGPDIPTGTKVVVVGVVNSNTLEVQPE